MKLNSTLRAYLKALLQPPTQFVRTSIKPHSPHCEGYDSLLQAPRSPLVGRSRTANSALPHSIVQRNRHGDHAIISTESALLRFFAPFHGPVSISSDDNQVLGRSQLVLLRYRFGLDLRLTTLNSRSQFLEPDPRMVFREAPSAATPLIMMATSSLVISQSARSLTSALKMCALHRGPRVCAEYWRICWENISQQP